MQLQEGQEKEQENEEKEEKGEKGEKGEKRINRKSSERHNFNTGVNRLIDAQVKRRVNKQIEEQFDTLRSPNRQNMNVFSFSVITAASAIRDAK